MELTAKFSDVLEGSLQSVASVFVRKHALHLSDTALQFLPSAQVIIKQLCVILLKSTNAGVWGSNWPVLWCYWVHDAFDTAKWLHLKANWAVIFPLLSYHIDLAQVIPGHIKSKLYLVCHILITFGKIARKRSWQFLQTGPNCYTQYTRFKLPATSCRYGRPVLTWSQWDGSSSLPRQLRGGEEMKALAMNFWYRNPIRSEELTKRDMNVAKENC